MSFPVRSEPVANPPADPRPDDVRGPARACSRPGPTLLALSGLLALGTALAHEWNSPAPSRHAALSDSMSQSPAAAVWPHRVWSPAQGMPAAPSARDCHRAPQRMEFDDGQPRVTWRRPDIGLAAPRLEGRTGTAADSRLAAAEGAAPAADRARRSLSEAPATAAAPAPSLQTGRFAPRPPTERVAAGVVDDNADFGEYLAYRDRHADLGLRLLDVRERYRVVVHDADGRPLPDAEVRLHDGSHRLPLWARTDAGGQVWLHPAVAAPAGAAPLLEVEVRQGGASARGLLRRGQRDDLQLTLDARRPSGPPKLDLVFLVDATGSMGDEIEKLQRSMRAMADQIAALPGRPDLCLGLVSYRDRGDEWFVRAHDFTDRLGAFQSALGALRAGGGGDMPEALDEALHTAVHRLSWRGDGTTRLIVLVADAPPHVDNPGPVWQDDVQAALARGIKLLPVGASGLDDMGEAVYRQLAQYTGGRFVFLTYADAADPSRGPGRETAHDVRNYSVESLDALVVRLVRDELRRRGS